MLLFKDRKVIDGLCKVLLTASRIGEHVNIISNSTSLQFFTVNASLTVVGETTVSSRLYEGSATKNTHIKARAAEVIARIISRTPPTSMQWAFITTTSGEEVLDVHVFYASGLNKSFKIPCMHIVSSQLDFMSPGDSAFSFSCLTSRLRDAFSHCDLGADEIKFAFHQDMVNIYTRKIYRGTQTTGAGAIGGNAAASLNGAMRGLGKIGAGGSSSTGLSTTVTVQPETFEQITIQTPLQLVFKFKEFRTVVKAFHGLSEKVVLQVRFDADLNNTTTVLEFSINSPVSPPFQYTYRFLAKQQTDSREHPRWLKIGRQLPEWVMADAFHGEAPFRYHQPSSQNNDHLYVSREEGTSQGNLFVDDDAMDAEEPNGTTETRDPTPETVDPGPQPEQWPEPRPEHDAESNQESIEEPSAEPIEDTGEDLDEIGYTQGGPTSARGLFD